MSKHVAQLVLFPDRVMLIQINAKPVKIDIVQVHATRADEDDHQMTEIYEQVYEIQKIRSKLEIY